MSKQRLIDHLATRFKSKDAAERAIDAVLFGILEITRSGKRVQIRGVGTFEAKPRKAWTFKNPKTGEMRDLPEKRVLTFRARDVF